MALALMASELEVKAENISSKPGVQSPTSPWPLPFRLILCRSLGSRS